MHHDLVSDPAPLPAGVVAAIAGRPAVGSEEPAFQLLTVREDGLVHVTLLSRSEIEVDAGLVLLALAGRTTPGNVERTGSATLVVVTGTSSCSIALARAGSLREETMTGFVMVPTEVREDSLGIPLRPITFSVPADLPGVERWDLSLRLLERLRDPSVRDGA